jgi:hypothetical protein
MWVTWGCVCILFGAEESGGVVTILICICLLAQLSDSSYSVLNHSCKLFIEVSEVTGDSTPLSTIYRFYLTSCCNDVPFRLE